MLTDSVCSQTYDYPMLYAATLYHQRPKRHRECQTVRAEEMRTPGFGAAVVCARVLGELCGPKGNRSEFTSVHRCGAGARDKGQDEEHPRRAIDLYHAKHCTTRANVWLIYGHKGGGGEGEV